MARNTAALTVAVALIAAACAAGGDSAPATSAPAGTSPETTTPTTAEPATTSTTAAAEPARGCDGATVELGKATTCEVPGWPDRDFDIHIPPGYDAATPTPLVVAFHGGGGTREAAAMTSCAEGDVTSDNCLHAVGDREGFVTVYPDGTSNPAARRIRTWNAGGGSDNWNCASGYACEQNIDDIAYVASVLDTVAAFYAIDTQRIFATGLSNGGAMSHRVGCELSDRFAAIAAVAGGNQLATSQGCEPSRPISILQIHGTDDQCWLYDGGDAACLRSEAGDKASAADTVAGWVATNDCGPSPVSDELPNIARDGTSSRVDVYTSCDAGTEVWFITVEGGGHTWPGGYRFSFRAGLVGQDFDASELIWDFFAAHSRN